ncbi:hypothetical protein AMATHDRAFT_150442 [Amanita thiersii Skay4041]|uniref:Kinetochore protein SPC25 n=1 Tax=Amanita thiersii Skay4041 TaxID=703135 RepID=A0A2A9NKH6_9AGAR|nr:hypothetical protein AMATHDRAFT_150442 [Amanita thiersii Skay4041]
MAHVLHLPQIDLSALLAESNPQINLGIEAYETSTRNFLKVVSSYKSQTISLIADRRNQQVAEKKKINERVQVIETETNKCKLRELELMDELEREKEERKDAELAVTGFKRQLASLQEKCTEITAEIDQYQTIVANLQREKDKERSTLNAYALRANPDLAACEKHLSCVFEGIEKDQLLIRFYYLNHLEPDQECSLVLDVSSTVYKVITSSPNIPAMPIFVEMANKTQNIFIFILQVHNAFHTLFQG